jgi:hypothetical protein
MSKAKEKRAVGSALKTAELPQAYHVGLSVQAQWEREAGRLFAEFWRTADQKHLAAFVVHIIGMRAHQVGMQ